jgi:hypothetical protein
MALSDTARRILAEAAQHPLRLGSGRTVSRSGVALIEVRHIAG